MKRYLRIFANLSSIHIKRSLENRADFISLIFTSLFTTLLHILFISIVFNYTGELNGWSKYEVLLVLGLFRVFNVIISAIVFDGIKSLSEYVNKGDLDIYLTRPINSQFFITFSKISVLELVNVFSGIAVSIYAFSNLNLSFSIFQLTLFSVNSIFGIIILYGIYFSIATLSIWFNRFGALSDLYYIMIKPLYYPISILGARTSFIFTFIVPLGFVITMPVSIFLGKEPIYLSLWGLMFACICLGFSIWFWNFSLKHYSSASS